jgi:6-pyruvoyltetrahydropterin/6-carboxytetrahydropterin synthase
MRTLIIKDKFDAAHYLKDYEGDCANLHGHTWRVEVYIDVEEEFNKSNLSFKQQ